MGIKCRSSPWTRIVARVARMAGDRLPPGEGHDRHALPERRGAPPRVSPVGGRSDLPAGRDRARGRGRGVHRPVRGAGPGGGCARVRRTRRLPVRGAQQRNPRGPGRAPRLAERGRPPPARRHRAGGRGGPGRARGRARGGGLRAPGRRTPRGGPFIPGCARGDSEREAGARLGRPARGGLPDGDAPRARAVLHRPQGHGRPRHVAARRGADSAHRRGPRGRGAGRLPRAPRLAQHGRGRGGADPPGDRRGVEGLDGGSRRAAAASGTSRASSSGGTPTHSPRSGSAIVLPGGGSSRRPRHGSACAVSAPAILDDFFTNFY